MAEREGFEPSVSCPTPHFQCGAFVHSTISPSGVFTNIAHDFGKINPGAGKSTKNVRGNSSFSGERHLCPEREMIRRSELCGVKVVDDFETPDMDLLRNEDVVDGGNVFPFGRIGLVTVIGGAVV